MHIPSQITNKLQTFQLHYPLVGPVLWIASVQYFITMMVVAMFWPTHYSVFDHTISDLGNTACGIYSGRYVCSPLHSWMNASFIVLGLTMVAGSTLIYQQFRQSLGSLVGFSFMGLAGIGTIVVGIFAENSPSSLHAVGAALPFVVGNIALLVLGFALEMPRFLRVYTIVTGVISLVAFGLFANEQYLGLGIGGMERLAAHPQTLWLIVFGLYISRNRFRT
jgi:hypothetical membrane protein